MHCGVVLTGLSFRQNAAKKTREWKQKSLQTEDEKWVCWFIASDVLYVHELIVCCTGGKGKQIKQSPTKSGGEIGMKRRQKMRSECRVLLVHRIVPAVFSPGCMCCTGFRGKQMMQSASSRRGEIGMKRRQKMRSECRVMLVHCIVPAVFSPGCMCCTGVIGNQKRQSTSKSGIRKI